ncbi:MAG: cobaltochelatase subunit CobN [Eubacteriaceae bacterium]
MLDNSKKSDGIFHPYSKVVFNNLDAYLAWYKKDFEDYVGILTHAQNFHRRNVSVETALIHSFEKQGIGVVPVFSISSSEPESGFRTFSQLVMDCYTKNEQLKIKALINFQMIAATGRDLGDDLFTQGVESFKQMRIPVLRPIISYLQTQKEWENSLSGLHSEISWAFTSPERLGMTEPLLVGTKEKQGQELVSIPLETQIDSLVKRVKSALLIQKLKNKDKKVALMLHSAPCAGVEATLGIGVGLSVFESVVRILRRLKAEGYQVENLPEDGQALKALMMAKKAYQDFRWTTVEEIVKHGGDLYRMGLTGVAGYDQFYGQLTKTQQADMEKFWGQPPGQGMVIDEKMVISGLRFGKVLVMIQPKRGCYGSKCTGEVCKILHDPSCPPPHQYLATYRYLEHIEKVAAVVHVGTGGSLEHLPGKTNAPGPDCWPNTVVGALNHFYCYNMAVGVEGIGAKRRSYAKIIDYLPATMIKDPDRIDLVKELGRYLEAVASESNQADLIGVKILEMIDDHPDYKKIIESETDFVDGVQALNGRLVQSINGGVEEKLHILGQIPQRSEQIALIKESLEGNSPLVFKLKLRTKNEYDFNAGLLKFIEAVLEKKPLVNDLPLNLEKGEAAKLADDINDLSGSFIGVENELDQLVLALNGQYLEPGLSGMPKDGLLNVLPTGRNFYLMDTQKVPTREAYEIGSKLAEALIKRHQHDFGQMPEKVALNMISTDISKTNGEELSQTLNLLGVRPVWNQNGIVMDIELISPEELKRPRIDVIVRISGVLRDSYPDMVAMMDQAVIMAAEAYEPDWQNFVRKNTRLMAEKLTDLGLPQDQIGRRSTVRIFGDKPGAYGSGVDLALKASAWEEESDLAKIFTLFSAYAYGQGLFGESFYEEFVANVKTADVAYETSVSKRYDLLSSSFSASVMGGFNEVKRAFKLKDINQYHGTTDYLKQAKIDTMAEAIDKMMDQTLFNPLWNEAVKSKSEQGGSEIMRKVQTVFDWKCMTETIKDVKIDQMVKVYLDDPKMLEWLKKDNPFGLEEITRRFMELKERKKWVPEDETFECLKKVYLEIQGDMEDLMESADGDYQGSEIEVIKHDQVETWDDQFNKINHIF